MLKISVHGAILCRLLETLTPVSKRKQKCTWHLTMNNFGFCHCSLLSLCVSTITDSTPWNADWVMPSRAMNWLSCIALHAAPRLPQYEMDWSPKFSVQVSITTAITTSKGRIVKIGGARMPKLSTRKVPTNPAATAQRPLPVEACQATKKIGKEKSSAIAKTFVVIFVLTMTTKTK